MTIGPQGVADRRSHPRLLPSGGLGPAVARLRPGRDATVIDLSRGGVCVEAAAPLRPGHAVDLRITLENWQWNGEAEVVRCQVAALPRDEKVRYRAGLRFPSPIERVGPRTDDARERGAEWESTTRRVADGTPAWEVVTQADGVDHAGSS